MITGKKVLEGMIVMIISQKQVNTMISGRRRDQESMMMTMLSPSQEKVWIEGKK